MLQCGFPFFHRSQPTIYQPLFPSRNCVASQVCLPFPTSLAVLTATHCMDTLPRLPSLRVLKNCWNGEFLVGRRSRLDTYCINPINYTTASLSSYTPQNTNQIFKKKK